MTFQDRVVLPCCQVTGDQLFAQTLADGVAIESASGHNGPSQFRPGGSSVQVTIFNLTAFAISLINSQNMEIDKVTTSKLELSYVVELATVPKNDAPLHLRETRIVLRNGTKLSKMLALTSDPEKGEPPR